MEAVLLQDNQSIAYATKALTETQQRYLQLEKEAFTIQFGCFKFHDFIYSKILTILIDHKPLESVSKKVLANQPRLQRIFFNILQYIPKIQYISGKDKSLADILSRDCIGHQEEDETEIEIKVCVVIPYSQTVIEQLRKETNADPLMTSLKWTLMTG